MAENTNKRSVLKRVGAATAATAVALGIGLATAGAAHAEDWTPPLTEPGQAGPSTSIEPPGSSFPAPAEPNSGAIYQDIMP